MFSLVPLGYFGTRLAIVDRRHQHACIGRLIETKITTHEFDLKLVCMNGIHSVHYGGYVDGLVWFVHKVFPKRRRPGHKGSRACHPWTCCWLEPSYRQLLPLSFWITQKSSIINASQTYDSFGGIHMMEASPIGQRHDPVEIINFAPHCPRTLGYTPQPNQRGTIDIIWGCVLVLFVCVWAVLHHNVPIKSEGFWSVFT
jgi:hypothetical protein